MAQHDMDIQNAPGLTFRADINNALVALSTINSGPTQPASLRAGMLWLDTSIAPDGLLRQRNQANSAWISPAGVLGANMLRTIITTSQTWTKPAGLKFLDVIAIGGGGGVGAAPLTAAAQGSGCSGGGGGGVVQKLYPASAITATVSITIGAGGATTPAAGSATTFLGLNAAGGAAGIILAAGTQAATGGGAGGAASGGDVNIVGSNGGIAWRVLGVYAQGGTGGKSAICNQIEATLSSATFPGAAGNFPGGGARGSANGASQAAAAAGAIGGAGAIILTEYY